MNTSEHTLALPAGVEINDLRIESVLGHGSFGITYLARDRYLQKEVALKEYFPNDIATRVEGHNVIPKSSSIREDYEWGLQRFLEEAQILNSFEHPNILRVTRFFKSHQTAYMVTEYEHGKTFTAYLKALGRPPTEAELRQIVIPLLDGLEIVHNKEYLHRDIKPDNIYICENDGRPVLIDFGSARQRLNSHTQNMTSIVTDGYAPFEQYTTSAKRQGPWSDIYSMAAVLYRSITNRIPPSASDRQFEVSNGDRDPWEPLAGIVGDRYSPRFITAIEKGLTLQVHERPQTVEEWRRMFIPQTWQEAEVTDMEFVWVEGGCFQMGDSFGDGWENEKPVHQVCVDGFYMGKYQVTQAQWIKIMGDNPSRFPKGGDYPVENVSWHDVQKFIRKLNRKTGKAFRLPTEAEWEYAASSGGQKKKYAGADDVNEVAWCGFQESGKMTHPVGSKKCNGFDLYDMSGNVWEWCSDWYDEAYYQNSPRHNPKGPKKGSKRVKRGGGWSNFCQNVRISLRSGEVPELKGGSLGFRLVLANKN